MNKPTYRDKHPCACGTGYLDCVAAWKWSLKCCEDCDHPGRWTTNPPYTPDEIADIQRAATA
jgi:hypothetical protein